jgi:hypothetical protein
MACRLRSGADFPAAIALNIYTFKDNHCFWDNTNSTLNWVGENSPATLTYDASGGDIRLTVNSDGAIGFTRL